ncbi:MULTISPECIES: hypothetical protein [Halomonadaceae]|uniref:hypothetical protein n=1 Tax=Halomonadaceae TaxID=28256 RepID=UPI00159926DA|nr:MULTISPECIES: hypothetical protein [Halomonas]QJQ94019.1 hypothetical protein HIO72_01040 [Halomonas sp. PA5]
MDIKRSHSKMAFEQPRIERVGTVGEITLQGGAIQVTDVPQGTPVDGNLDNVLGS